MQIQNNKKIDVISAILLYAAPVAGVGAFWLFSEGDGISMLSNVVITLILAGIYYTFLHMNQNYLYGRIFNPLLYFGCFFLSFVLLGGKAGLPLGVFWMLAVVIAALDSGLELALATHAVLMVQYAVLLFPRDKGFYRFSAYILLGIVVALLFSQLIEKRAIPYLILILLSCDGVLQCVVYQFNMKEISAHPVDILVELCSLLVFVVAGYLYLGYRERTGQAEEFYEEELSEEELEAEKEELFLEGQAKKLREAFQTGGSDLFAEGQEDEFEENEPEENLPVESSEEELPEGVYVEEEQSEAVYEEEHIQNDLYIKEQAEQPKGDLFAEGSEEENLQEEELYAEEPEEENLPEEELYAEEPEEENLQEEELYAEGSEEENPQEEELYAEEPEEENLQKEELYTESAEDEAEEEELYTESIEEENVEEELYAENSEEESVEEPEEELPEVYEEDEQPEEEEVYAESLENEQTEEIYTENAEVEQSEEIYTESEEELIEEQPEEEKEEELPEVYEEDEQTEEEEELYTESEEELVEEQPVEEPEEESQEALLEDFTEPGFELLERLRAYSETLYLHSERIALLSERAARAVGGNATLAKAGGFYHEIGRVEEEENYIEAGTRIGREYGFPEELLAVMRQHSTGFELPKSTEAAVVMLSDCIISTSDFLAKSGKREKVSDEKLVTSIFQNRLDKGNMEQSGMTEEQVQMLKDFYIENTFTERA